MRRTLGTLALVLALAGCGDDDPDASTDRSVDVDPPVEPQVVLVSQSAGGGRPAETATDVSDQADLATYVEQFDDGLAAKVAKAVAAIDGGGARVLAQVIAVGCDVPPGAVLEGDVIVPAKVVKPLQECFAPVTTVGVVAD